MLITITNPNGRRRPAHAMRLALLAAPILAAGALASTASAHTSSAAGGGQPGLPTLTIGAKAGQRPAGPPTLTAGQAQAAKTQATLLPVAEGLAAQASAPGSDIAGVMIDADTGTIHVYRTNTKQALAVHGAANVVVHQAKFNRTAMVDATTKVTKSAAQLSKSSVSVVGAGPNVDGSGISVTILTKGNSAAAVARATAELRKQYGSIVANVTTTQHAPAAADLFYTGWRFNDYAPWYGGDRIYSSSAGCSTGFAANIGSTPVMLTAAHCGGVGTAFSNGPSTTGTYRAMGSSVYSNNSNDIGAIAVTSYSTSINVGSALAPTQLNITSWGHPLVGQYLCESGSYTGEVCGLRVVDTGQSVCIAWFIWCTQWQGPLADVVNYAGPGMWSAGHGDSGGPVYLRNGSTGTAMGLVHGMLTPNAQAAYPAYYPLIGCPSPEGWSVRCSSGFSFAHMPGY